MSGWTDKDDASYLYETLPEWHPAICVDVFHRGLEMDAPGVEYVLQGMVTPESVDTWGAGFSVAREFFGRRDRMSLTPLYGIGAPDVAYVKFVADDGPWMAESAAAVEPTGFATVVWRPEAARWHPESRWLIHSLGEGVPPDEVPRSAVGFDPRR